MHVCKDDICIHVPAFEFTAVFLLALLVQFLEVSQVTCETSTVYFKKDGYILKSLFPKINSANVLYIIGLMMYLLISIQFETYWDLFKKSAVLLQYIVAIILTAHLLFTVGKYKRPVEQIFLYLSFCVSLIAGRYSHQPMTVYVAFLLVFGAKGINFSDILKTYVLVGGVFWLVTVIGSQLGWVKNVADETGDIRDVLLSSTVYRFCLGYRWCTNMANHIFFVLLAFFSLVKGKLSYVHMLIMVAVIIVIVVLSDCRLSAFCISLTILFGFICRNQNMCKLALNKTSRTFFLISIPAFLVLVYCVTKSYDASNLNMWTINLFLSNRLGMGQEMLERYGVPWTGQYFKMYSSVRDDGELYNYVDSSYLQLLMIFGILFTILFVLGYVVLCRQAIHRKDVALLFAIFLGGLSGLFAQHFIEFYMNPLLIALFASHESNTSDGRFLHAKHYGGVS